MERVNYIDDDREVFAAIDLFAKYVGKTVVLTLCGLFALVAIAIIHLIWFWVITSWVKPEWHGSYHLGDGIYMKVWDGNTTHLLEGSSFSHNGGAWKAAKSIKDIMSRETRSGTYDENFKRIGD